MKKLAHYIIVCLLGLPYTAEAQSPLMGWSSWNTYRVKISDSLIRRQADAMVATGLKDAGYRQINIDDGYFGWRDKKGTLHSHPKRFPNGMRAVADYIHSLGLRAGIYSDAGANTCGSIWDADKNGIGVGLYGHEHEDAQLMFNEWGFDFIKIDYCGAGQQLSLDERERYTAIANAINSVAKKHVAINICRWAFPGTWAADISSSWRMSADINASWQSVRDIISQNLYLSAFARGGHYNDMDMLEIGRGLTDTEEQTHFGMWCIMSSPLLIGCDLTKIPEYSLRLLTNPELIALNQDSLHLQAEVVQHEAGTYVLAKDIQTLHGTTRAVAFYNPTDNERTMCISLADLLLDGSTRVRDLVTRKNMRPASNDITIDVEPHGVRILRLDSQHRLMRTRYEAESAYLPLYDGLGKRKRQIMPTTYNDASGGMVVTNVGGSKDNCIVWNDVYTNKKGKYRLVIDYLPAELSRHEVYDRRIEVYVNGRISATIDRLERNRDKGICQATVSIDLAEGQNTISIGSNLSWCPDIDGITLVR